MSNITTTATKLTINTPKYYNQFRDIHNILVKFTNPYIFIIGFIGLITNTSTIVLLSKNFVTKSLKHKWALIALALSDIIYNIALLIRVFHGFFGGNHIYFVITISFLSHLAEVLSACFTVLFTIQRYTAVRYPIQAATHKRLSPIVSCLLILAFSIVFYCLLIRYNDYSEGTEELHLFWFITDALFSFVIPFSLILMFNILIINLIRKHGRSSITVQSTLRRDKQVKYTKIRQQNQNNPREESCSGTYSYGCPPTLQGTLSEADNDKKMNLINSLNKHDESTTLMKKKETIVLYNNVDGTQLQSNNKCISISPNEIVYPDMVTNDLSQISKQDTTLPHNDKKKMHNISLNLNGSQEVVFSSYDAEYVSPKDSQTTQSIRVTRMLVLVSTCFLILNAPVHICMIALKIYTTINTPVFHEHTELSNFLHGANLTESSSKKFVYIQADDNVTHHNDTSSLDMNDVDDKILIHLIYMAILITQAISYASYSINFLLYSFSGITFRTGLRQFLNKLRSH
ncbi:unnamed protein product [Adineta steineri]|uniref:G-protein coupled receptors family 1 profile domain-containing protein n=1 Tax=Adineta steineri TaxID=433720 RepID=A0A814ERN2_9BILA|nr:unnamed protein product [Adineta steineri]